MNRRTFLAASLSGTAAATAGCAGLPGETTTLAPAEVTLDADGMEKHLFFEAEGDRVAVISLDQMTQRQSPTDAFRLRLHVSHRTMDREPRTTVDGFRFDLRAPPTSVAPPAEIYLQSPGGGSWPDLTFEQVDEFWTRIAADGTGEVGVGTVTLTIIVNPRSEPVDELGVRASVELSESGLTGERYLAEARTRFEPV